MRSLKTITTQKKREMQTVGISRKRKQDLT